MYSFWIHAFQTSWEIKVKPILCRGTNHREIFRQTEADQTRLWVELKNKWSGHVLEVHCLSPQRKCWQISDKFQTGQVDKHKTVNIVLIVTRPMETRVHGKEKAADCRNAQHKVSVEHTVISLSIWNGNVQSTISTFADDSTVS